MQYITVLISFKYIYIYVYIFFRPRSDMLYTSVYMHLYQKHIDSMNSIYHHIQGLGCHRCRGSCHFSSPSCHGRCGGDGNGQERCDIKKWMDMTPHMDDSTLLGV